MHVPATAAVLAVTARECPAVTTLCLSQLPVVMDNDEGAAAVVRLFPHKDRLVVFDPDGNSATVSAAFVAGVVRRRALHTLVLCHLEDPDGGQEERLTGVVSLQVGSMDIDAAVFLGRCASLRSLYLRSHSDPEWSLVSEAVAAALVPPGLTHLTLADADFGPAAVAALVMAAGRATPPTLRSLTLSSCTGEVATALVAAEGVPTLRRVVLANHDPTPEPLSPGGAWDDPLALLAVRRPYVVFVATSCGEWLRVPGG